MDLYYGRMSGNSSRAVFGLEESGATYDAHLLDTRGGANKTAAYLTMNPMGKIPALKDGSFTLWESNAINLYAAEKNPHTRLIPDSVQGRASMHRWLFFQGAHVSPACLPVMRSTNARWLAFWNSPASAEEQETGRKELARYLPVLEQALFRRDWLEGTFSLADIALAPHLLLVMEGGFDFAGSYPAVRSWLDRIAARPAWRKTATLVFGG